MFLRWSLPQSIKITKVPNFKYVEYYQTMYQFLEFNMDAILRVAQQFLYIHLEFRWKSNFYDFFR